MTNAQSNLTAGDAEPASSETVMDNAAGMAASADGEPSGAFESDTRAGPGRHSLLSRSAPQGRRSLFGR